MANQDEELTVAQRLGRALDRGLLPAGGPAEAAERLIERLERPARIALLGLPGSGKSSILNLLVGAIVVPETLRLPTIVVQYGENEWSSAMTLPGNKTSTVGGWKLAVFQLPASLLAARGDQPVPVAVLQKDDETAFNLVLGKDDVKLVRARARAA